MSFMQAVRSGDLETVETALKLEPSFAVEAEHGISALLWALYYRQDPVAHLIRSYRSTVSIHEAAALGEIETIEGLLEENPELSKEISADGFPALGLAAFFGHLEACKLLIKAGADVNKLGSGAIVSGPLHAALSNGFIEVARFLVESGADVNLAAGGGYTALHYTADLGDAAFAAFLLSKGANPKLTLEDGRTAADLGRDVGHYNVSEVLET